MDSKKNRTETDSRDFLDLATVKAGSAGDVTGLIPAAPHSQAEYDSYKAIAHFAAELEDGAPGHA